MWRPAYTTEEGPRQEFVAAKWRPRKEALFQMRKRHTLQRQMPCEGGLQFQSGKTGHFSTVCRSKQEPACIQHTHTGQITTKQPAVGKLDSLETAYLDTVVVNLDADTSWTAGMTVGSKDIQFKLGMGAEVTAITEDACACLQLTTLNHASKILYGPM